MENCIFCKIINKKIPAKILYEDELTLAIMDVNPVTKGHILVVPKKHYENIFKTPEQTLQAIAKTTKIIANLLKEKLQATGVNVLNASGQSAQQSVFHLHYHVVARYDDDNLNLWFHQEAKEKADINKLYKILTTQ